MKVSEIYISLLGESSRSGRPCVLVRFAGCSLRCSYCDTPYAFEEGESLSAHEVAERVESYGVPLVLLTGGEPMEQAELHDLVRILLDRQKEILIETGGAIPIRDLHPRVIKILDIKCPSSGHAQDVHWENLQWLGERDEVKFVLSGRKDYDWAKEVIARKLNRWKGTVLLSPVHGKLSPRELAEWMVQDRLRARLQIQLHKYIWPEIERGV